MTDIFVNRTSTNLLYNQSICGNNNTCEDTS